MPLRSLKINVDSINSSLEEVSNGQDGVQLGSLRVSTHGMAHSSEVHPRFEDFTINDLMLVSEKEGQLLGRGSSGSVWRAIHKQTKQFIALKEVRATNSSRQGEIQRELEALYGSGAPTSPYMVELYGAFYHEGAVYIAMECLDGSLDSVQLPIPIPALSAVARSVLHGLAYLHRQRHLIHRDIKPSNLLFNRRTGAIKLADFGISSNLDGSSDTAQTFVGTLTYMSPERLKGEQYSFAADIWSYGLTIAEMAMGSSPYDSQHVQGRTTEARFWSLLEHVTGEAPVIELPPHLEGAPANFIRSCLKKDPACRPTCTELLEHPFLTSTSPSSGRTEEENDREIIKDWLMHQPLKPRKLQQPSKVQPPSALCRAPVSEVSETVSPSTEQSGAYLCDSNNSTRKKIMCPPGEQHGDKEEAAFSSSPASTLSLEEELQRLVGGAVCAPHHRCNEL